MGNEIFSAVITITVILLMLFTVVVVVIVNYKQRQKFHIQEKISMKKSFEQQLLQSQIEVQESTYKHIAKELHDNVGQLLSTTKMLMGVTELKLATVPETLSTANATLGKAIQELRLLSRSLDKEWLEQFDFFENLETEVARINTSEKVNASITGKTALCMKAEEQIILFRIVQEAVQNALRHASPEQLAIIIEKAEALVVKIINDGKPLPSKFHGMGTKNMLRRARLFGGDVQWESGSSNTIVTITLPLKPDHEN